MTKTLVLFLPSEEKRGLSFATRACPTRINHLRGAPPFHHVEPINDVDLVIIMRPSSQKRLAESTDAISDKHHTRHHNTGKNCGERRL